MPAHPILALQSTAGNHALARTLRGGLLVAADAGGRLLREPVSGPAAAGPATPGAEDQETIDENILRAVNKVAGVGGIFDRRKDAVDVLMTQVDDHSEDPALSWELISAAAAVALGAATGGIGGIVATRIAGKVAEGAAKAAEDLVKETIKGQLETIVKEGVDKARKDFSGSGPSRAAFKEAQLSALNAAAQKASDALLIQKSTFKSAPDGVAQSQALLEAYDETLEDSFDQQFIVSLAEWANLVDRSDIWEWGMPDAEESGILGFEVSAKNPGAELAITGVYLEGIPQESADRLRRSRGKVKDLIGLQAGGGGGGGLTLRVVGEIKEYLGSGLSEGRMLLESRPGNRGNPDYPKSGHGWYFLFQRGRMKYAMGDADDMSVDPYASESQAMVTANLLINSELGDLVLGALPEIEAG
jgi:hypothetical protein